MSLKYEQVKSRIETNSECKLLSEIYINTDEILKLLCKCGNPFDVSLRNFGKGKHTCEVCSGKIDWTYEKVKKYIEENSDCKLLSTIYKDSESYMSFQCKCGKEFPTTFYNFKSHDVRQCKKCGYRKNGLDGRNGYTYEEVKEYVEKDGSILVSKEYDNCQIKLDVVCKCGHPFRNNFMEIKHKKIVRCASCNKKSNIEIICKEFFEEYNVEYMPQKKYSGLLGVGNGKLSYDFYIPRYNLLIEGQGIQHDEPRKGFGGDDAFIKQKEHDKRKREYAKNNGIELLEIWHWEFDFIRNILIEELNLREIKLQYN